MTVFLSFELHLLLTLPQIYGKYLPTFSPYSPYSLPAPIYVVPDFLHHPSLFSSSIHYHSSHPMASLRSKPSNTEDIDQMFVAPTSAGAFLRGSSSRLILRNASSTDLTSVASTFSPYSPFRTLPLSVLSL
mmetsp:Transcript_12394/g.20123  ORF Transcript_12394/g.20123 Transcript_12394/m.20123 type:complete len:131 (+) Transcript_12394:130-522(+)